MDMEGMAVMEDMLRGRRIRKAIWFACNTLYGVQLYASKLQLKDRVRLLRCMTNNEKDTGCRGGALAAQGTNMMAFSTKTGKYRRNTIACGTYQQSCTFLARKVLPLTIGVTCMKREVESRTCGLTFESKHI